MKRALLGALLVLCAAPYGKGQASGDELLHHCEAALNFESAEKKDPLNAGVCLGFINGVRATIQADQELHEKEKMVATSAFPTIQPKQEAMTCSSIWRACVPREVTTDQLIRVVVRYLKDHPEKLHFDPAVVAHAAFKQAFPCKQQ